MPSAPNKHKNLYESRLNDTLISLQSLALHYYGTGISALIFTISFPEIMQKHYDACFTFIFVYI